MSESFDAVVVGMGPGGEVVADRLLAAGRRVVVVERELIGGECGYWACIPSKTLLRPPEARGEAARAAGVRRPDLDWGETASYRDEIVRHLDDGRQVAAYEERGATVIKGSARLTGPGCVSVDGRTLEATDVVIATGSDPVIPPIDGLDRVPVWTNREATNLREIPERALVVGAGPVALELGQMMGRFGAEVTLVESAERVLSRETAAVSELIEAALVEEGIGIRTGCQARAVRPANGGAVVELTGGAEVETDVVIVATGRRPRVHDLGLETVGVEPLAHGLPIDDRCRLADGLWAVGDATGVQLFTHVAKYQGRIVASNILGGARTADYRAVPRVVFTDPELAAVGLSEAQAGERGLDVAAATIDLAAILARPITYEREPRGQLGLVADREGKVLVGAWAVAPMAGEWIHLAATAIHARIPIPTLLDQIIQFPTYSEGFVAALEQLEL